MLQYIILSVKKGRETLKKAIRIGIIDMGSNSIRLVIYEQTEQSAHRIIDECKVTARLSEKVNEDHNISIKDLDNIVDTLIQFKRLCEIHNTFSIRTVATAAIRNASNDQEIIQFLLQKTGLKIEILSGEEEARLGFVGTMNTLDVNQGFLIDIGGGSTELTLIKNRRIVNSISFPFGSVNTTKRFPASEEKNRRFEQIRKMVQNELKLLPWLQKKSNLPLIGLGGTLRNVCKMNQKQTKYSLPQTHNYEMNGNQVTVFLEQLKYMSLAQLKKVEGLSKDRADIIIPGMIILDSIYQFLQSSRIIISGSGLRDGLFHEIITPEKPLVHNVIEYSVNNLLALYPSAPKSRIKQVNQTALQIFDQQYAEDSTSKANRKYLHLASLLFRIGISIDFYNYYYHTFYLILNSRINGLTHREKLMTALIASFKTKNRSRKLYLQYKDILSEADFQWVVKLGLILNQADTNYPQNFIKSN